MRLAFLCGEATSKSRCTTCQGQCIKTSRGSTVATHRSDVVGSLLRPAYLAEARRDAASGRLGPAEFKRIEDRAVDEAVALQEAAGLDVVTDGEMRRYAFFGHLIEALDGFDRFGGWAIPFRNEDGEQLVFKRPVVVERLRWRRSMCGEEFAYLRARARRPAKTTLISAQQAAAYYDPEKSRAAYPTRDAYLADVVDFTRREVEELIRLGCTYIQIDAPQYAALLDPEIREGYRRRGSDPDRLVDTCIEMDNAVIGDHPGVTFGLHICRGNNQSMFYASGGYEPIAERVFRRARFQRFLLEYDDERSGSFAPLRAVPDDRTVVLGLATTKKPRLETVEELAGRIEAAAKIVPLERLALSPQCGFASTLEGNRIPPETQRRKLEVVAATARAVWRS
ncbi:MAG: methionine synthase [Candidatus Rokuibacteriota bacterium]|nr:MAG: methionine synthase [Candidatus Rokubacteria bacterium]PYN56413.1 MAG: methionine synthase [Candidatus Rokubacteria bacterium]